MSASSKPLLSVLHGAAVDPPPVWFMRQAGRYLPEYRALRAEAGSFLALCLDPAKAAEVTIQPIRRFAMDGAILFADILVVPYAMGIPVDFREGEGPVVATIAPGDRLPDYDPAAFRRKSAPVMETVARVASALPASTTLIGFAGAPWTVATYMVEGGSSREFARTKAWAFADPVGFDALIDLVTRATIDYLRAQVEAGAEAVQLFDSWSGVLAEPAFRRWCIAPARRIVDAIRQHHPGVPVIGFPRLAGPMIPVYAAETGVDAVGLDTTVPLGWARDAMPGTVFQGNLDPRWLVVGGDGLDGEIRRIRAAMSGHPLIFNLGHGVVPETPPEHVARAVACVRAAR